MRRVLIAGFGNLLRGDDGFGIAVIRRLEREPLPDNIRLLEVGTGGIHLAQELLSPYDHLIVVDAMVKGGTPGSLYTVVVDDVAAATVVDLHAALPARALAIAKALGGLPRHVHMIGCEPDGTDELMADLSAPVREAIEPAVRAVLRLAEVEAAG